MLDVLAQTSSLTPGRRSSTPPHMRVAAKQQARKAALIEAPAAAPVVGPAVSPAVPARSTPLVKRHLPTHDPLAIFISEEETHFYSQCLERFLLRHRPYNSTVVEFGSGDGTPVVNCLRKAAFSGVIHGFELNPKSAALAKQLAAQHGLDKQYQVHNRCFYEGIKRLPAADCLIANPPYIPAPDNNILMPALFGGVDGANLTRDLMSLGFDNAVLLISAYSNPVLTLQHARAEGYRVTDYMVTPLPFGYYSSEPKVRSWLEQMKAEGKAFFSSSSYLLAGVLLQKDPEAAAPVRAAGAPSAVTADAQNNIVTLTGTKKAPSAATPSSSTAALLPDMSEELLRVLTAF